MPENTPQSPAPEPALTRKTSVVVQLTLIVTATLVILLGALIAVGYFGGRMILREQVDNRLSAVAESRRDFVVEWIGRQQDRVDIFATRGVLRNYLEKHVAKIDEEPQRTQSQENLDGHVRIGAALVASIVDRDGMVLLSSDPAEVGRNRAGEPIFQDGLKSPTVGRPRRGDDGFVVELSAPTRWIDGTRGVLGVVVLKVDATPLADALNDTTGLGKTGEVVLGVQDKPDRVEFLFPPRYSPSVSGAAASELPAMVSAIAGRAVVEHAEDYRGVKVLAVAWPVGYAGWALMAKIDEREAYAPIDRAGHAAVAMALVIAVCGLAGAYSLARGFTRPIRRLAGAAESVARGRLDVSVPVRSSDELGALTSVFNNMTAALRARTVEREKAEAELMAERARLRTLIDVLPLSLYVKDERSRFIVANVECARAVGASSPEELLGKTDADFFPPELAKAFWRDEQRVLAGESILNLEEDSVYPDGKARTELTTKVPVRDGSGKIVGIVGVSRDITERRQSEEALRASEALLRSITDHTEDIIFVKDLASRTIFKNPAGLRANALPADRVIGHTDTEFCTNPEQAAKFIADDRLVMESRSTRTVEEELTAADGKRRVLLTTKTPRFDAEGKVVGLVGVARDITAQKESEAARGESEARLRSLGDNIPGGAIYQFLAPVDGPPRYAYVSAGIERLLGIPSELVLADANAFSRMIVDEDRVRITNAQMESARQMSVFDCEFRLRVGGAGEIKWLHARATPRRLADGALLWDGVVTDVTERKNAEAALRESEERYELAVTGADAAIWDWDVSGMSVYYSPRWAEMRGYTPTEISDREDEWSSRIHPDDSPRVLAALRAHLDGNTPVFSEEYRIRCKDGSWKWVHDRGLAQRDASGKAIRMAGSETDITDKMLAEAALRESEDRFRAFMDLSPIVAWIKDDEFRVRYANKPFAALFQQPLENLIGQTDYDYLPRETADQTRANDAHVLKTGEMIETIEHVPGRDGMMRHWLVQKFPLVREGRAVWVGGTAVDLTQRFKAEEEVKASLHEKEVLLREVHHRVKNNLQIVSSLLNLQSRQLSDPALIEVFSSTRDRVRAMAAVHERLYESGDFAKIDLASHLSSLSRMLTRAHTPAGANVQLALRIEPVTVDLNTAVPLSLIANEVIINSLKYAFIGRGAGVLTIELRSDDGFHELRIADDGPGFPAAVDPTTTRTLGLRLVRDLARQIRGELRIDSQTAGTNIEIRWPVRLTVSDQVAPAVDTDSPEI